METVKNVTLDEERALYGKHDLLVSNVSFDGPADGESALKECRNITVEKCFFNLRYPMWHIHGLKVTDSELTVACRAALWYCENVEIDNSQMHGIKALRECKNVTIGNCDIVSPEFGWSVNNIHMTDCTAQSEYFMLRAENLVFRNVRFSGKYSFQYIRNARFENCVFDTKDAFWHAENVVVKDSIVNGEYLAWYSDKLTFVNCTLSGTQQLCYCKNLNLVNCQMNNADLCFEKSYVNAEITTPVISIKNVYGGKVCVPEVGQIICDDENAKGQIVVSQRRLAV